MATYQVPESTKPAPVGPHEAILVASGDLRLSANQMCWPAQDDMEKRLIAAFAKEGVTVRRGHAYDPMEKHGFISSQRMGIDVFQNIHPDAPLIVAEAVWQYTHHVLAGRTRQRRAASPPPVWGGRGARGVGTLHTKAAPAQGSGEFT